MRSRLILIAWTSGCIRGFVRSWADESVFVGTEKRGSALDLAQWLKFFAQTDAGAEPYQRYHGCNARRALQLLEAVKARRIYVMRWQRALVEHLLGFALVKTPRSSRSQEY